MYSWLWGHDVTEILLVEGILGNPDIDMAYGYNGIHTSVYDNGEDPVVGTAPYAIKAVEFTPSTIYVTGNWWGFYDPDHEEIFDPYASFSDMSPLSTDPSFDLPAKPAQRVLPPEVALYGSAIEAERAGDDETALRLYKQVLRQYPESDRARHSMHRIARAMRVLDTPEATFREFYRPLAEDADVSSVLRSKAEGILEASLKTYGHRDQLIDVYRARAEAPGAT